MLIGVNTLTPNDAATRREAVELLVSRQCADGGWNFGNASVYDVDLRGYAQTTAFGLIALQRGHEDVAVARAQLPATQLAARAGGLTVAQALAAFRFHGVVGAVPELVSALDEMARRPSFAERPLAVAWATLSTGPDELLAPLKARA